MPTRNLDNSWNEANVKACEQAKMLWMQATSRKEEGVETYKVDFARDQTLCAEPKWPTQSLDQLISVRSRGE